MHGPIKIMRQLYLLVRLRSPRSRPSGGILALDFEGLVTGFSQMSLSDRRRIRLQYHLNHVGSMSFTRQMGSSLALTHQHIQLFRFGRHGGKH